jgi:hypothetical protein
LREYAREICKRECKWRESSALLQLT